jgi:hypothetical protein
VISGAVGSVALTAADEATWRKGVWGTVTSLGASLLQGMALGRLTGGVVSGGMGVGLSKMAQTNANRLLVSLGKAGASLDDMNALEVYQRSLLGEVDAAIVSGNFAKGIFAQFQAHVDPEVAGRFEAALFTDGRMARYAPKTPTPKALGAKSDDVHGEFLDDLHSNRSGEQGLVNNPYPQVPESVQNHPHFAGLDDADFGLLELKAKIKGEFIEFNDGIALFEIDGAMTAFDSKGRKLGRGWLGGDGTEVNFVIDAKTARSAGANARGSNIMESIFYAISRNWDEPKTIRAVWQQDLPDNLKTFNRLHLEEGMTLEEAAANTFTGKMVSKFGFKGEIKVLPEFPDKAGNFTSVQVIFAK